MGSFTLLLIGLLWLAAALGLLVWGGIVVFKQRSRWKRGLGFVILGVLLMAARFVGSIGELIHKCVSG